MPDDDDIAGCSVGGVDLIGIFCRLPLAFGVRAGKLRLLAQRRLLVGVRHIRSEVMRNLALTLGLVFRPTRS